MPQVSKRTPIVAVALFLLLAQPCFAADDAAKLALGKEVFSTLSEPQCAFCHTLDDAKSVGKVGPNLDTLKPDLQRVETAVTNGLGVMPAFAETLSKDQIAAVAYYVATVVQPK
jgi:cytochrome c6